MMNNNELRLGNLVQDIVSGEWLQISGLELDKAHAVVIDRSKFPLPDNWEMGPIKLTSEILEKIFGFEYVGFDKQEKYFVNNLIDIQILSVSDKFTIDGYPNSAIEYVHDLQNLCYSLNNKTELPVNLEYVIKRAKEVNK